jgi:hypothetical protein
MCDQLGNEFFIIPRKPVELPELLRVAFLSGEK